LLVTYNHDFQRSFDLPILHGYYIRAHYTVIDMVGKVEMAKVVGILTSSMDDDINVTQEVGFKAILLVYKRP